MSCLSNKIASECMLRSVQTQHKGCEAPTQGIGTGHGLAEQGSLLWLVRKPSEQRLFVHSLKWTVPSLDAVRQLGKSWRGLNMPAHDLCTACTKSAASGDNPATCYIWLHATVVSRCTGVLLCSRPAR